MIELGSPVAEHDVALANYFVETDTFSSLIQDKRDTIAGDKGTGKSALYKILKERFTGYAELGDVEVIPAFNPAGEPAFQRIIEAGTLDEEQYVGVWKAFFLSVAGNWILELFGDARPGNLARLEELLGQAGLRNTDQAPQSLFAQLMTALRPESVEGSATVTPEGIPIFSGKVAFSGKRDKEEKPDKVIRHAEALRLLDTCLAETGFKVWLVLDRLDEAFQAHPQVERPALRALFRAYLDMQDLAHLKLKMFVRKDLFGRIVEGGFVNLTHVNARKMSIIWEHADLYTMLYRRLMESDEFVELADLEGADADTVFAVVFPKQVDQGSRRPSTWDWMLTRIRDGNNVKSPRNLVDLVAKAIEAQQRRESGAPRVFEKGSPLITGDALKQALKELSKERLEDTLLAEAGESADLIKRFRNGKAEHNASTLRDILGPESETLTEKLIGLGFLEQLSHSFRVPMLYRNGLGITNGKAFLASGGLDSSADED